MAKKTDCLDCGTPRPGQKLAGLCVDCFDLHIATQKRNVRGAMSTWENRDKTVPPYAGRAIG